MANLTDFINRWLEGQKSLDDSISDFCNLIEKVMTDNSYTCEICGRRIPPKVTETKTGICVEMDCAEVRGGLGNKVLKSHVCPDCYKNMGRQSSGEDACL